MKPKAPRHIGVNAIGLPDPDKERARKVVPITMTDRSSISCGTPEALIEVIHDAVRNMEILAYLAQYYIELGDPAGLEYTLKSIKAYLKVAAATFLDLKAMKEADHA